MNANLAVSGAKLAGNTQAPRQAGQNNQKVKVVTMKTVLKLKRAASRIPAFAAALTALTACATNPVVYNQTPTPIASFEAESAAAAAEAWLKSDYHTRSTDLRPGDRVAFRFSAAPDLNHEQLVQPSGQLNLPYVGTIDIKGKTINEIDAELTELYTRHLREPELSISLMELNRPLPMPKLYLLGAVENPGRYEVEEAISVFEALAIGGGMTSVAEPDNVLIMRRSGNELLAALTPLTAALDGENEGLTLEFLRPGDIVYVPATELSEASQAAALIRQLIGWNGLVTAVSFRIFDDQNER